MGFNGRNELKHVYLRSFKMKYGIKNKFDTQKLLVCMTIALKTTWFFLRSEKHLQSVASNKLSIKT